MGSFSTTEGTGTSFSGGPPIVVSSLGSFPDKRFCQESIVAGRGGNPASERCVGGSYSTNQSRFLFPSIFGSQKERENETCTRPFGPESVLGGSPFQNGNQQVNQGIHPSWDVDYLSRLDRCLLPYWNSTQVSEVSQVGVGRQGLCFQSNALRPFHGPFGIYKSVSDGCGFSSHPVDFHSLLPRRFSGEESVFFSSGRTHPICNPSSFEIGISDFLGEIRHSPQSRFHFSRGKVPYSLGPCCSSRGENSEVTPASDRDFASLFYPCSTFPSVSGFPDITDGHSTIGSSSHSTYSVVSHGVLASSISGMGSSHSCAASTSPSSQLVVTEGEPTKRFTSRSPGSKTDAVHRCLPFRLGRLSGRQVSFRPLVSSRVGGSHQCSRDEGSFAGPETLLRSSSGSASVDSHRQFNCGGLSSEPGRNPLLPSVSSLQRDSSVLQQNRYFSDSEACTRQTESCSRSSISLSESCEYRMGITSSSFSADHSVVGSSPHRSVCNQFKSQTGNLCISHSGRQGDSSRCYVDSLERDVQLHVSSLSSPSQNSVQDSQGRLQDHSYCSSLAETELVSRSAAVVLCKSSLSSSSEGSIITVQRQEATLRCSASTSSRLDAIRSGIRKRGFSGRATKRISGSVRQSTGAIYDSKWSIFCSWCNSKQIDPLSASVQQLADFFIFLFEDQGFAPSTIKGYRSAISRTIHLSGGENFGENQFLSLLIKNFYLERPKQRRLVPPWDLAVVLKALQLSPFEPLSSTSFQHLSYKCCFLLALASGRRRSEIHAFSISESCMRFTADKTSVTLLTDPSFLAKNQLADKGSGIITIPSLPAVAGDKTLCPVRTLLEYLSRSSRLRRPNSTRLFIPIKKGVQDISAKTISTWICQTVLMAYKSSPPNTLSKHKVKAHEVRALASSWNIFNSSSLSEVLSAGYWRSDSTFYNHYLRSMPHHCDNLFALGPLVTAQQVVVPPNFEGDSALR